jgi:hypothetical protein
VFFKLEIFSSLLKISLSVFILWVTERMKEKKGKFLLGVEVYVVRA